MKGAEVAFNPVDNNNFTTTIQSRVDAKKVEISLIGGLHGDLAPQAARLIDLDDVANALKDKGIDEELLELGRLGGATTKYIRWMQATYLLAVDKKALQWPIRDLVKTYPGAGYRATDSVSLTVADGEFVVLVGPSGCVKTTLLRMVAGLQLPDSGSIAIGGKDVTGLPARRRNVSMVFLGSSHQSWTAAVALDWLIMPPR